MPLYTRENNSRLSAIAISTAGPQPDSLKGLDQTDAEPYILNSFGDTLQTIDDLWRPPYTVKTSIPSADMRSRPDSAVLPRMDIDAPPPSYSERPIQSQTSRVNRVSASPKGVLRVEGSESRATQSPTDWMSESGGSTLSRSSMDSPDASVKIARRARPARKPLPPSKRSSASSVMGNKGSRLETIDRDSSGSYSAQQSLPPSHIASRDPTPASSSATITSLDHTASGSFSLRDQFELGGPDRLPSREGPTSLDRNTVNAPSKLARSHSRDKSNTALNILNSFPMAQSSIPKNVETSRYRPSSSSHIPPSPPAVPLHASLSGPIGVPPLTLAHHECYHSHRTLQLSRNVYAPVPCMTCYQEDNEPRWKCSWCCLRICRQCLEHLENSRERTVSDILCSVRKKAAYVRK